MTSIVIVDKSATIKSTKVKDLSRDTLYKKCGYRKPDGFVMKTKYVVKKYGVDTVEVWARDTGKAGTENKYDLPPPIDKELLFGSIAIAGFGEDDDFVDLSSETWKKVYELLFGGFEDIDDPESEEECSEDELDTVAAVKKTKAGYLKDGFVVDGEDDSSNESCSDDDDDDDDEESESETDDDPDDEAEEELSCGSELEAEEYYYSDDE